MLRFSGTAPTGSGEARGRAEVGRGSADTGRSPTDGACKTAACGTAKIAAEAVAVVAATAFAAALVPGRAKPARVEPIRMLGDAGGSGATKPLVLPPAPRCSGDGGGTCTFRLSAAAGDAMGD